jgi:hypothetical protein
MIDFMPRLRMILRCSSLHMPDCLVLAVGRRRDSRTRNVASWASEPHDTSRRCGGALVDGNTEEPRALELVAVDCDACANAAHPIGEAVELG